MRPNVIPLVVPEQETPSWPLEKFSASTVTVPEQIVSLALTSSSKYSTRMPPCSAPPDLKTVRVNGDERAWALASRRLAQSVAYPAGVWSSAGGPVPVGDGYIKTAKASGERQIVTAGVRLATALSGVIK